jgi:hypothetical protein
MPRFVETENTLINVDCMAYARKRDDHVEVGMLDPAATSLALYPVNCSLEELWTDLVVPLRDEEETEGE